MNKTRLETKVAARNEVNAIARAYVAKCRLALYPMVGQKITLSGGGTSSKFNKLVGSISLPISCYISTGHGYSVTANFRVATTGDNGTFYAEATLYLFDIKDGVMVANPAYDSHIESAHYRTDFNVAEIVCFIEGNHKRLAVLHESGQPLKLGIRFAHMAVTGFSKPPGLRTLEKYTDCISKTPTGHKTEPDGFGPDGSPSWLLVLELI